MEYLATKNEEILYRKWIKRKKNTAWSHLYVELKTNKQIKLTEKRDQTCGHQRPQLGLGQSK